MHTLKFVLLNLHFNSTFQIDELTSKSMTCSYLAIEALSIYINMSFPLFRSGSHGGYRTG